MGEEKPSILPELITPISEAAQKNIPDTVGEVDGALSTVVGFFNNVVLYPVKKANITFRYKLEAFESDLKDKIKDIPEENLQVPATMIAGPTLEALRYAYDEAELREMYENLLASAMDNRKAFQAHPSFVDAIKQMSPIEAMVLERIVDFRQLRCANIKFCFDLMEYVKAMPNHFVPELIDLADPFIISASLVNLERLALIQIIDGDIKGKDYEVIKEHPYVVEREKIFRSFGKEIEVKLSKCTIRITNYGEQFVRTCLAKEI